MMCESLQNYYKKHNVCMFFGLFLLFDAKIFTKNLQVRKIVVSLHRISAMR